MDARRLRIIVKFQTASARVNSMFGIFYLLFDSLKFKTTFRIFFVETRRCFMKVQVQKWGNSLALRIPKSFAIESNIGQGSTVEVSLENGRIIVFPVVEPEFSLDEMLAQITAENLHGEVDTGSSVGQEIW